jgi:adenylate cyclase, class 2
VDGVGTFVELELSADERTLDAARSCILSLARQLELSGAERRSYLELLLSAPDRPPQGAPKQRV